MDHTDIYFKEKYLLYKKKYILLKIQSSGTPPKKTILSSILSSRKTIINEKIQEIQKSCTEYKLTFPDFITEFIKWKSSKSRNFHTLDDINYLQKKLITLLTDKKKSNSKFNLDIESIKTLDDLIKYFFLNTEDFIIDNTTEKINSESIIDLEKRNKCINYCLDLLKVNINKLYKNRKCSSLDFLINDENIKFFKYYQWSEKFINPEQSYTLTAFFLKSNETDNTERRKINKLYGTLKKRLRGPYIDFCHEITNLLKQSNKDKLYYDLKNIDARDKTQIIQFLEKFFKNFYDYIKPKPELQSYNLNHYQNPI